MSRLTDAFVALASSLALLALGALLVLVRPRRGESLLFGAFTILWAAQIAAANAGRLVGRADVHAVGLLASFALMPPAYLVLLHLASPRLLPRRPWVVDLAASALAAVAACVILLAPRLVVDDVLGSDGALAATTLGPLAAPLFIAPFHVAFVLSALGAWRAWRGASEGAPRRRARALLCAFVLYVSYASLQGALFALDRPQSLAVQASGLLLAAPYALGILVLALVALDASRGRRQGSALVLLAVLAPAAGALAERAAGVGVTMGLGAWRLACAGVLAYAIARYRLFDLDLRLRQAAGPVAAALLVALAAAAGGVAALRGAPLPGSAALAVAGGAAAAAALRGRERLGALLFPRAVATEDYLRERRLDVYRVRLEASVTQPRAEDERELADLRDHLGLSEREHEVMRYMLVEHHAHAGIGARGIVGARYRFRRHLGEGGFGRAYLAHDEVTDSPVVVKVYPASEHPGADAAREAELMRRAASPHVVRVLDVVRGPQESYVVQEHVAGGTLEDLLARTPRLAPDAARGVAEGILHALAAAHAQGVVHGDVKPENVLLTREGSVKLADFGSARLLRQDATQPLPGSGTLRYMSPEQVRGEPPGPRSDLYAVGVVLHRCLAGRHYLGDDALDDFETRRRILEAPPDLLGVPEPARAACARALEKRPQDRFASAHDMLAALRGREPLVAGP